MNRSLLPIASIAVVIGLMGCGPSADIITKDLQGRRVHDVGVYGSNMIYYWSPAQSISSPNHLVLRDLATGAETNIESPWQGNLWDFDGERVAFHRPAPDGGTQPGEIVLYEVATGTYRTIPEVSPHSLAVSGDWVVWVQRLDIGKSAIARCSVYGGEPELIDIPRETDRWRDEQVHIDGDTVAWVRYDNTTREYRLYTSAATAPFAMDTGIAYNHRFTIHLGQRKVVYVAGADTDRAVRMYDLDTGGERVIYQSARLWSDPQVGGGVVAWMERVTNEEFERLRSRPLDSDSDWRNVDRYDIASGRMKTLASAVHTCFRVRVDGEGNVYAIVQREITDPSQTNLVYGVDIWKW
jgi:hypothetical protein